MSFVNKYPYTDFHELNLDWILDRIKELDETMANFVKTNKITYSGTWDITTDYPAWTVVVKNNVGYLSLQPVPAGTLHTDTDYWSVIFDINAPVQALETRMTAAEGQIVNIQKELTRGKFVFFGDSYEDFGKWYERVCTCMGLSDQGDAFYAGASGHGFTVSGNTWLQDFNNFCSGRTDLADFKHVIVAGGLNDATNAALASDGYALKLAINNFCDAVKAAMPNATIYFAYIGSAEGDSAVIGDRTTANRIKAIYYYTKQGTANGVKILHNTEYVMNSWSLFAADGLHPTTTAGTFIGNAIAEALQSGCSCHVYDNQPGGAGAEAFQTGDLTAYGGTISTVDNGFSYLLMKMVASQNVTNAFIITSSWTALGQVPYNVFLRTTNEIDALASVSDSGSTTSIRVKVKILNSVLYVQSNELNTIGGYVMLSVATGKRFDLYDLKFIEDTLMTM